MSDDLKNKIYSNFHHNFFDRIINKKRFEIINIVNDFIDGKNLYDVLDVGTTADNINLSSNIILKNLKGFKIFKSISDQKINTAKFSNCLNKSITEDLTQDDIKIYSSDLVISNATIEHVGNMDNQLKMLKNIIKLTKKYFIIITPNRFHPIEFHSKLPFIHWFPKKIHRSLLKILGVKYLSKEENLNLLSKRDFHEFMKKINFEKYELRNIRFLLFNSNIILIGSKD